jgi:Tol biopolymer transport system component
MAQPFDVSALQFTGDPVAVIENVGFNSSTGRAQLSVSDNGTLVYRLSSMSERQLTWFDRQGKEISKVGPPGVYEDVVLSPDGKRAAVSRTVDSNVDIWTIDLERGLPTRFTFSAAVEDDPAWSPDGRYIIFTSPKERDTRTIYRKIASGAGNEELVSDAPTANRGLDWSSDGKNILYTLLGEKGSDDLWVLPLEGEKKPHVMLQSEFYEDHGHFSPDGRFFAYVSNESGRGEVYVQTFPLAGGKWQISTSGGDQPHWRRDGKELYYIAPDKKLMAVSVKLGDTLESGAAIPLFQTQVSHFASTNRYDVTADGQRFLVNSPVETTKEAPFTVILNWTSTLKK